ncbi:MAG: hypothetical protein HYS23_02295 [Geobacter sp.]|nr:hypothetical protein [Geobacter sp.]
MVMVKKTFRSFLLLTIVLSLLLAGCAKRSGIKVTSALTPPAETEFAYVVPFVTTLVPESFGEPAFNGFVDTLNASRGKTPVNTFLILKEELKEVDPAWLEKQLYITGEIWSYIENSGCCSTELRVKGRVQIFEPGRRSPAVEIFVPLDSFFDHDASKLSVERDKLSKRLARELADQTIKALAPR